MPSPALPAAAARRGTLRGACYRTRAGARRGAALAYVSVCLVALLAVVSLAVDVARVRAAKSELQTAADASARHALGGLSNGTAVDRALAAAADNKADGSHVMLARSDVELGTWDLATRAFVPGGSPADAVRVTARRTAARGNPVPLAFARVIGLNTCDVQASAVATAAAPPSGIVGLDSISFSSQGHTDSYNSAAGPYSAASAGTRGSIQTNGSIDLKGKVYVGGDARPGPGNSVTTGPGVVVTGSTAPLPRALSFPVVNAAAYATRNDNINIPSTFVSGGRFNITGSNTVRFPPGVYYFTGWAMSESSTVEMAGRVTIYVAGNVSIEGGASTFQNRPVNLTLRVAGPHLVEVKTSGDVHAVIYAPEASVNVGGGGQLFGSVIGRNLVVNAHGGIHYDESLGTPGSSSTALVQ